MAEQRCHCAANRLERPCRRPRVFTIGLENVEAYFARLEEHVRVKDVGDKGDLGRRMRIGVGALEL